MFSTDPPPLVCGFEAYINDKHVVGVVKEKEQAHREYKEAVSKGHGAYLMDEETPVRFTYGNVQSTPLKCKCLHCSKYADVIGESGFENVIHNELQFLQYGFVLSEILPDCQELDYRGPDKCGKKKKLHTHVSLRK